jgi:hypothetical protein
VLLGELGHGRHDVTPGHHAIVIAGECKLVVAGGAFLQRSLAIALEHELCRAPNVDLG